MKIKEFTKLNRKKTIQLIFAFIITTLIVLFTFGAIWIATPYKPSSDALALLKDSENSYFKDTGNLEFIPKEPKSKGIIFYPGGRVEAQAYSYICSALANQGYPCIIAVMPFNLAVFKIDAGDEIISKYPEIQGWIIGGHSLGGSMAARYVNQTEYKDKISGIVFLASYSDIDLSKSKIPCSILIATKDNILNFDTFSDNFKNFPDNHNLNVIQGGNHSQFGDYGLQQDDGNSEINKDEQHQIVVAEFVKLLN